ncbi:MAG: hypothetical protein IKC31_07480 [Clostridia bacterium]|nr:hypothetical protein [Clostridia bacterium]
MKKENISHALNNIDFDMVEDAYEGAKQKKASQKILWYKWGTIAACLTLMIIVAATALPQKNVPSVPTEEPQFDNTSPSGTEAWGTQAADPSTYAPKVFTSVEEFVAFEKSLGEASSNCYYIPSALGDDYELYSIRRQEKNPTITYEHITINYKLKGADINEESLIDLRTKMISCEYSVREYSDTAFESYANNGFEAFEYGGRQLYKLDIYTADKTTLLSYRVIFRIDGHLIAMNLPAIDSFENMMKYTDVIRVDIE